MKVQRNPCEATAAHAASLARWLVAGPKGLTSGRRVLILALNRTSSSLEGFKSNQVKQHRTSAKTSNTYATVTRGNQRRVPNRITRTMFSKLNRNAPMKFSAHMIRACGERSNHGAYLQEFLACHASKAR